MRILALWAALFAAGCTSPGHQVSVQIRNRTNRRLVLRTPVGMATIEAGGRWTGWVDRRMIGRTIEVEVGD